MTPRQTCSTIARRLAAALLVSACAAAISEPCAGAAAPLLARQAKLLTSSQWAHRSSPPPAPLASRELWATVDVCTSKPKPLIGIRGSMPSDGHPQDTMYMLFRVQYFDASTKSWSSLGSSSESGFVKVGTADTTRQAGRTFDLSIPGQHSSFQMRGMVEFQWRNGSHVALSATRLTSGGHRSAAGAIPRGYSASTCTLSNG